MSIFGLVCAPYLSLHQDISNLVRRLAILNGQATILFARDISTIPLSQKFLVKTSDTQETEISSELIRAFHIDFAVLQDVILSQMCVAFPWS